MKDYLTELCSLHPVRRTSAQKEDFFNYVYKEFEPNVVKKDLLEKKHNNIIIGDIEKSEVLFTAHYDTPATSIYPNLMMPRNKWLTMLYHTAIPVLIAFLSLAVAYGIGYLCSIPQEYSYFVFLPIYLGAFFLSTRCFTNKNNKNDNTSGVATLLTIAKKVGHDKVAFVLFDNEEKGLLGSKAMAKKYKELMKNKLVVNFDCVGNGSEILYIAKKDAMQDGNYFKMIKKLKNSEKFTVHLFSIKGSTSNSDFKNFERGVGVMACSKGKFVKFYTGRIHTPKDVVASSENVEFIANQMVEFVSTL